MNQNGVTHAPNQGKNEQKNLFTTQIGLIKITISFVSYLYESFFIHKNLTINYYAVIFGKKHKVDFIHLF